MELTQSQLKVVEALIAAGQTEAAQEASRAYAAGKTYNPGRRPLPQIVKSAISRANDAVALKGRK